MDVIVGEVFHKVMQIYKKIDSREMESLFIGNL